MNNEVNDTWIITSELANQRERLTLSTVLVYTKIGYRLTNLDGHKLVTLRAFETGKIAMNSLENWSTCPTCSYRD